MEKQIFVDEALLQEAKPILDRIGLDASSVLKMTLKRVISDNGISFLFSDAPKPEREQREPEMMDVKLAEQNRMTKSIAVNQFRNMGCVLSRNVTFASKNRSSNHYWANPTFDVLTQDWFLILNDWMQKKLYLFKIPAQALAASELICRTDNSNKIDLQITYNDTTFTDSRSKISFSRFLLKSITMN